MSIVAHGLLEALILYIQSLNPLLVYVIIFAIAYIENVFPPSPSDLIIVFAGSLIALQRVGFFESLAIAAIGSTLGFVTMYKIGDWFGVQILERGKIKFLPRNALKRVETWFAKYGYAIIIANRFMAGTRAVVSFFAGMSKLRLLHTTVLCFLSALAWNSILLAGGYYLGQNWRVINAYLTRYGEVVTGLLVLFVITLIIRHLYRKKRTAV